MVKPLAILFPPINISLMKSKIIVRREEMEIRGLAEKILPLCKIVSAEQHAWILVPQENLTPLVSLLKENG